MKLEMLFGLVWVIGVFVVVTLVLTIVEGLVFYFFSRRIKAVADAKVNRMMPVDPINIDYPIGRSNLNVVISKESLATLEQLHDELHVKIGMAGMYAGLLIVAIFYAVLIFLIHAPSIAFWALIFVPLVTYTKVGQRGVSVDRRRFGEIYAILNQRYYGGFSTISFIGFFVILLLRLFKLVP